MPGFKLTLTFCPLQTKQQQGALDSLLNISGRPKRPLGVLKDPLYNRIGKRRQS